LVEEDYFTPNKPLIELTIPEKKEEIPFMILDKNDAPP